MHMNQSRYFKITWTDLSIERQEDILESIKPDELEELRAEAKQNGMTFKELMTHKNYYAIDDDEFFDMNVAEFVEKLAMKRIYEGIDNLVLCI